MKELGFSLTLHLLLFGIGYFSFSPDIPNSRLSMVLEKGSGENSVFFFKKQSLGNSSPSSSHPISESREGTLSLEKEIEEFHKKLTYPTLALEQGLEDNCSFLFSITENGKVEKVAEAVPCRFQVFSDQVRAQAKSWKFGLNQKQEVLIPVRFRIHE